MAVFEGKTLFEKRVFPSNTAIYLSFTIIDVLLMYDSDSKPIIKTGA